MVSEPKPGASTTVSPAPEGVDSVEGLHKQIGDLVGIKKSLEGKLTDAETKLGTLPQLQEQLSKSEAEIKQLTDKLKLYGDTSPEQLKQAITTKDKEIADLKGAILADKRQRVTSEFGLTEEDVKDFDAKQLDAVYKAMKSGQSRKATFDRSGGGGGPSTAGLSSHEKIRLGIEQLKK